MKTKTRGRRLKQYQSQYILKYGYTVKQMAKALGVSYGTAWGWLRDTDKREAMLKRIKDLA